jgi:excisionase family DNA binding protein
VPRRSRITGLQSADDGEIGIQDVAKILGVSIPTATKVLDRGEIPSRMTPGGHRRVTRADAVAWRESREAQRASLHELIETSQREERRGPSLPSNVTEDPDVE